MYERQEDVKMAEFIELLNIAATIETMKVIPGRPSSSFFSYPMRLIGLTTITTMISSIMIMIYDTRSK